jgi:hypothetical protein
MSKNTKEERNAQLRGRLKPDVTGSDKTKQEGGEICAASPLIEASRHRTGQEQEGGEICAASPLIEPPRPDEITEER